MTSHGRGKWQEVFEDLCRNPDEPQYFEDVPYYAVSRLRGLGATVEVAISQRRADTGRNHDLYTMKAWVPSPQTELETLSLRLATLESSIAYLRRDIKIDEAEFQDAVRVRNNIYSRLRKRKKRLSELMTDATYTRSKLNLLERTTDLAYNE